MDHCKISDNRRTSDSMISDNIKISDNMQVQTAHKSYVMLRPP
jgi:NDP-sugar pyrophosphorylase family protein